MHFLGSLVVKKLFWNNSQNKSLVLVTIMCSLELDDFLFSSQGAFKGLYEEFGERSSQFTDLIVIF